MQYAYEPYVLWRRANGRIVFVNPNMSFEFFLNCFQSEQPFFILSRLADGRIAITPNALCIPWNFQQAGYWQSNLLPSGYEYFTMKHGTYPVLVSAHPIADFEEWFREFERCVEPFANQTLSEFIGTAYDYVPLTGTSKKAEYVSKEPVTA